MCRFRSIVLALLLCRHCAVPQYPAVILVHIRLAVWGIVQAAPRFSMRATHFSNCFSLGSCARRAKSLMTDSKQSTHARTHARTHA